VSKRKTPPPKTEAKATANKGGRPSIRTEDIVTSICLRLAQGEPLAQICREDGMPGLSTVYDWQSADKDISGRFARAREAGFDQIALDALRIADDATSDRATDSEGRERVDNEAIQRSRLRVETRLKLLAKWDPKRYGDRLHQELTGANGGPIKTEQALPVEERQRQIDELLAKMGMTMVPK
jgi:transposase